MKKIMFDNKYGLTQAVLEWIKTMTRRAIGDKLLRDAQVFSGGDIRKRNEYLIKHAPYKVGEEVAIAQSYGDIFNEADKNDYWDDRYELFRQAQVDDKKGWTNKMFVRADLMPHRIRITDIKVEHLQDISEEDCLKEGIYLDASASECYQPFYTFTGSTEEGIPVGFHKPRFAFEHLIDKISGKGTWKRNPLVFAYSFELIQ